MVLRRLVWFLLVLLVGLTGSARADAVSVTAQAKRACAVAHRHGASRAARRRCTRLRRAAAQAARVPAAATPTTSGRPFSPTSPFNTPVPDGTATAPNSAALVASSITPYVGSANLADSDAWGIAVVQAGASDPVRRVGIFSWGYGAELPIPPVRIPDGARPTTGDDHHLAVLDGDQELDLWGAAPQADGSWLTGSRAVLSRSGDGIAGPTGATAAGFALTAGLVRPEEIAAGHVDHALAFTSPSVGRGFLAPAVKGDGGEDGAMPLGTHIQLDPSADLSGLPAPERIVARALQRYGAFLTDRGGSLALYAEASIGRASQGGPSDIWSPVGVSDPSLADIPWSQVRVVAP